MKKTLFLIVFMGAVLTAFSQNYGTAAGFRTGLSQGLTVKHFMSQSAALEGILAFRWGGINITGLFEIDNEIGEVDGLTWFYGIGAHVGFWDANDNANWFDNNTGSHTVLGIDGIIGLEYTIPNAPINFQLDYKPAFNLIGHSGFWGDEGGLSVRYTFN